MIPTPFVENLETHLFAEPNLDDGRCKQHLLAILQHCDLHDAKRLCGIAGLAGGEMLVRAVRGRYRADARMRRQAKTRSG